MHHVRSFRTCIDLSDFDHVCIIDVLIRLQALTSIMTFSSFLSFGCFLNSQGLVSKLIDSIAAIVEPFHSLRLFRMVPEVLFVYVTHGHAEGV